MSEVAAKKIEQFLLENRRWVKADELCARFGIRERQLRAYDGRPGQCSEFAISGDKGFKHVQHASEEEFQRSDQRSRRHAIGEFVSARLRRRYRQRLLTDRPPPEHEVATGQVVMAI
jgi:hypothetical protein